MSPRAHAPLAAPPPKPLLHRRSQQQSCAMTSKSCSSARLITQMQLFGRWRRCIWELPIVPCTASSLFGRQSMQLQWPPRLRPGIAPVKLCNGLEIFCEGSRNRATVAWAICIPACRGRLELSTRYFPRRPSFSTVSHSQHEWRHCTAQMTCDFSQI